MTNAATKNFLEGATISIPALHASTFSDETGWYQLSDIPSGNHIVVVSYTGLDEMQKSVAIDDGRMATLNFDLTSTVYLLESFTVSGEREGNARALTTQRNADSIKHVVAMDAFGNLANDNAGELLRLLPGIAGDTDMDGNINVISIRGAGAGMDSVTVDGNDAMTNGNGRSFQFRAMSGAMFSEIEVTKAPTPDMSADSFGGAINMKSASPLNMRDKRRVNYKMSLRWSPYWIDNVPLAHKHPLHPTISMSWQEVLGVFGGRRNLGMRLNLFYSENASGGYTSSYARQDTTSSNAYVYSHAERDAYNNTKQSSASLRFDYKLSPATTFYINTLYNQDDQPFNRQYLARMATNEDGRSIADGHTATFTEALPANGSTYALDSRWLGLIDRQANLSGGGLHKYGHLNIDYNIGYAESHSRLNVGNHNGREGGGTLTLVARGVGWALDRSASESYPAFIQTAGPDISDPGVYANPTLTRRDEPTDIKNISGKFNFRFKVPSAWPSFIKAGLNFRRRNYKHREDARRWRFNGGADSLAEMAGNTRLHLSVEDRLGKQLPFIDGSVAWRHVLDNPGLWAEDLYYAGQKKYEGNIDVTEGVYSSYMQATVNIGKLKLLGGMRYEFTKTDAEVYYKAADADLSTAAEKALDPLGAARNDWANYQQNKGSYGTWFPGAHLLYKIGRGLQARASWSNGMRRPGFGTMTPSISVNADLERLTVGNPGLKPQKSENWDAGIEYYFEPVGQISANVFRKNLTDFFVWGGNGTVPEGADNGYGGDYAGYEIYTRFNGGSARIEGLELSYQQRLTFLPKPFSSLSVFANYTRLRTEGNYGRTDAEQAARSTTEVVGFVPKSGNAGLGYGYRGFHVSMKYNYTGRSLDAYNASTGLLRYSAPRNTVDASVSYATGRGMTIFCDIRNITNSTRDRAFLSGLASSYHYFTSINFGIKGRF
ncbi:MAG: TonB-dependent receptor [Opitutaceae bacterium]|nr:TonB-dependent receptor [Opitutaceae bacterium]